MNKTYDIQDYLSRVDSIVAQVESGETWDSVFQEVQAWLNFDRFNVANTLRHHTAYVESYDRCVAAICSTPDVDVNYVVEHFPVDRSCWNALASNAMVPIWFDSGLFKETFRHSLYLSLLESWRYLPQSQGGSDEVKEFLRVRNIISKEFLFVGQIDESGVFNITESLCDQGREPEIVRLIQILVNELPIPQNKQWHHMYEQIFAT